MNWYIAVLKKYAEFSGRARRQEFWMFVLINFAITIVLGIIDGLLGDAGLLGSIYGLAVLVPSIAVGARRLHDINKTGWLQLVGLIPLIGWIIVIIWFAKAGDVGPNAYGADPKGLDVPVEPVA
jgi:uncharacterized membrane protein YhaH (DUF805 family)